MSGTEAAGCTHRGRSWAAFLLLIVVSSVAAPLRLGSESGCAQSHAARQLLAMIAATIANDRLIASSSSAASGETSAIRQIFDRPHHRAVVAISQGPVYGLAVRANADGDP